MTDALQRALDAIDAVTADVCGWCQATLTDTAYSRIYCSQDHQARWQAAQAGVDPDPDLLDHDWPMSAVRSRIAGQLSQRLPGAQVHVNGYEVHVLGVRIDHCYVDELVDDEAFLGNARLLTGNWEMEISNPAPIGALFAEFREIIPGFLDGIRAATSQNGKPPTDPRARALWLRQNRNTGPAPRRQRPPKNLTH